MNRRLLWPLAVVLAVASSNANAFFFFFIPGGVVNKIGDAFTGAEGDNCVKDTTRVGDVITSPAGNKATVKSLSGTSSRCQNPALPIRALLVFDHTFSSKAGIDVPEGYEPETLTDMQRFEGGLLKAENWKTKAGFYISTAKRAPTSDMSMFARNIAGRMSTLMDDAVNSNDETIQVNGLNALRFEVRGKNKGIFGRKLLYVVTIIESDHELLVINAWSPDEADKASLQQLAFRVTGLTPVVAEAPPAAAPPASAQAQETAVVPMTAASAVVPAATAPAPVPVAAPVIAPEPAVQPAPVAPAVESVANRLRELDKLRKEGLITQTEFEQKKKSLLKEL